LGVGGGSKALAPSDVSHGPPSGSYGKMMLAFHNMLTLYICWKAFCHNVYLVLSQPSPWLKFYPAFHSFQGV